MKVLRSPPAAARFCCDAKKLPRPLVLVPTMGALHAGHLALIERARTAAGPRGSVPVRIIAAPTVREPDGLALSSRNQYLSAEERAQAPVIRRALLEAANAARAGKRDPDFLKRKVVEMISSAPLARIDYVEAVDTET